MNNSFFSPFDRIRRSHRGVTFILIYKIDGNPSCSGCSSGTDHRSSCCIIPFTIANGFISLMRIFISKVYNSIRFQESRHITQL
jgi:hypothetical protein